MLPDRAANDTVSMSEGLEIQNMELPARALCLSRNSGMRLVLALGHDRDHPQVRLSELLMTADRAAGIPVLSHLGVSSNHSAKYLGLGFIWPTSHIIRLPSKRIPAVLSRECQTLKSLAILSIHRRRRQQKGKRSESLS